MPPDADAVPGAFGRMRARLREPRQQLYAAVLVLLMAGLAALAFYPYGKSLGTAVGIASKSEFHGRDISKSSAFVSDSDLHAPDTPIVMVGPAAATGSQEVVVDVLRRGRAVRERTLRFAAKPLGSSTWGLVRWGSDLGIARISHRGGRAQCVVVSLNSNRPLFAQTFPLPQDIGKTFKLSLAPGVGSLPDLYALEFGRAPPPNPFTGDRKNARLHVLSGASGFRHQTAEITTPLHDLVPSDWTFRAARVEGDRTDLVIIRHSRGTPPEIHVLSGEKGYESFISEHQLDLSSSAAGEMQFVPINRNGQSALASLATQRGAATVTTFVY